ncbi:hypothetical protein HAX54_052698, partial [Datura stramonium]|nr:hypothetical protein [Datura stramonium]
MVRALIMDSSIMVRSIPCSSRREDQRGEKLALPTMNGHHDNRVIGCRSGWAASQTTFQG